jgi:hypothetical protein
MDEKLINEDIQNIKYLFDYKPGRVISEQDFDYTTDDYLDTEMDEERKPERLVKHIDTGKLVGSHKHKKGFHPNRHGEELGFEHHPIHIPYGTKFGATEVGDFDYEEGDFNEEVSEDKDDLFLRRRLSTIQNLIDKNINEVEEEGTLFSDEFEFADNIISWVVQDLITTDYTDHDYDDLMDLVKDNFGDYILSQYVESDFDEDDEDEDTLFEQEEPETDRYMFFSNLEQIHRQTGILLEKDPEMISDILENGHDWAQDHIATAKESIDQVFDFLMNEENGDDNNNF